MSKEYARSSKKGCGGRAAGRAARIDEHPAVCRAPSGICPSAMTKSRSMSLSSDSSCSSRAPRVRPKNVSERMPAVPNSRSIVPEKGTAYHADKALRSLAAVLAATLLEFQISDSALG
jgi:hypothetical protein